MKVIRYLVAIQSCYLLLTALWPFIDINSFMLITGPKQDVWLVKTVAVLLIPVALCLSTYLLTGGSYIYPMVLGSLIPLAFMTIDFHYAGLNVISDVYLIDGVIQVIFFGAWMLVWITKPYNITHAWSKFSFYSTTLQDDQWISKLVYAAPANVQKVSGIIPTPVHGMLDYVVGIFLIAMPWIFHLSPGFATWIPVALGAAAVVYSIFTDYEWGIVNVIPLRVHLSMDLISGILLALSPWLFGFAEHVYQPHLYFGVLEIVVTLLTRPVMETNEEVLLRILRKKVKGPGI